MSTKRKSSLSVEKSVGWGYVGRDPDGNIGAFLPNSLVRAGVAGIGVVGRRRAPGRTFFLCEIKVVAVRDSKGRLITKTAKGIDNRQKGAKDVPGQLSMFG